MPAELKVGNVVAKKGEYKKGYIKGPELNNGMAMDVPVLVMNGVEDGPTLLLGSTQHGPEIQGIQVILTSMNEKINPKKLKGAVIGIPVMNPTGFMANRYRSWVDHLDLGAVRADNPNGGFTEMLNYALWTEAGSKADAFINMHCNTQPEALLFTIADISDPKTAEMNLKIAEALGYTVMRTNSPLRPDAPATFANLIRRKGAYTVTPEYIDGRWISEPSQSTGVRGILNVLKVMGMMEGKVEKHTEKFYYKGGINYMKGLVRPKRGGLIRFLKKNGELIKKDEVFCQVYNLFGETVEDIKMPFEGYTWSFPCGDFSDTSGEMQTVNSGCGMTFTWTHESD